MDDFILLHHDRDYLKHCLCEIKHLLEGQKMSLNAEKTFIQPLNKPILFLGFVYRFTETGKLVILVDSSKVKHERKKIQRMVALVKKGERTKHDVDMHFKAWKASVRYGNSHNLICRLNRWYKSLWEDEND